ncbi:MAG: glutathione peroxidase [Ignavibacteriaceae bacterium]
MKKATILFTGFVTLVLSLAVITALSQADKNKAVQENNMNENIKGIMVKDIDMNDVNLSDYTGKVLLIVNVASQCGYTPQYAGLQEIYEKYKGRGFEILAFPCNQFGGQEPGTNEEIKEFCSANYEVTFKLFNKIEVNGPNRSPLYERLTNCPAIDTGDVKWNFEKFLISRDGKIIARFRSKVEPMSEEIISAIEEQLNY